MYIDSVMERVNAGLDKMDRINKEQYEMIQKRQWLIAAQMHDVFMQTAIEVDTLILIYSALK